eukprot:gene6938-12555_t
MAYPDFSIPFVLHTDASQEGLGAVLYQKQQGKMRVIGYASRTLSPAERKYHLHSGKLEFLALKWAVTEQFRDYLFYAPKFTIYTDNNPLTYVMSTAKLNSTGYRWIASLADFEFTIKYRPGKANVDADFFSRMPTNIEKFMEECTQETSQMDFAATLSAVTTRHQGNVYWIHAVSLNQNTTQLLDVNKMEKHTPMPLQNILQAQKEDPDVARVLAYKEQPVRPSFQDRHGESAEVKTLMHEWNKLILGKDRALYRKTANRLQLVLPKRYHSLVLRHLHDEMGHLGAERVTELARDRFYWPHMTRDIEHYVTKVCRCLQRKKPSLPPRAPAQSIVTSATYRSCKDAYKAGNLGSGVIKIRLPGGRETEYTIHIGGYAGDIGDSMETGYKFSTWDNDNDNASYVNCAATRGGPWWHNSCGTSRLMNLFFLENGSRHEKMKWKSLGEFSHKITFAEMKLRE